MPLHSISWFEGPCWRVELPESLSTRLQPPPPPDTNITSMGIARGWVEDTAMTIIVTVRPSQLEPLVETLAASYDRPPVRSAVKVQGAPAVLLVGTCFLEDGVAKNGYERVQILLVPNRDHVASLTVRTPDDHPLEDVASAILATFQFSG